MQLRHTLVIGLGLLAVSACSGSSDGSVVSGASGSGTAPSAGGGNGDLDVGTGGAAASGNSANGSGEGEPLDPIAACAASAAEGQPTPVDLYFMVDITGSMHCPVPDVDQCNTEPPRPFAMTTRWTVESAALKSFMDDPANAGLGVGLRFFPSRNNLCSAESYVRPTVEIAALPGAAMSLDAAIAMQEPGGQTPTVASIDGAVQHAQAWAMANPTHRVAVVYSTDGYPMGCSNNTIDQAASIAQAAFAGTPSIPVFVLGVGPNLNDLNKIAAAGGTEKAFLIDTKADATAELLAALATIRTTASLGCTYTIPAPPKGESLEPGKVNVTYTDGKGTVSKILRDPANTDCSKGSGWQYSADGKEIDLCGAACEAVKADQGGKLQVLFGCTTQVGEPPK